MPFKFVVHLCCCQSVCFPVFTSVHSRLQAGVKNLMALLFGDQEMSLPLVQFHFKVKGWCLWGLADDDHDVTGLCHAQIRLVAVPCCPFYFLSFDLLVASAFPEQDRPCIQLEICRGSFWCSVAYSFAICNICREDYFSLWGVLIHNRFALSLFVCVHVYAFACKQDWESKRSFICTCLCVCMPEHEKLHSDIREIYECMVPTCCDSVFYKSPLYDIC